MQSLDELFKKYPWKTPAKFIPLARRYGFNDEKEVRKFLATQVIHDKRPVKPKFLPVFSSTGDSYQFDILVQPRARPFLVFININTRMSYAYQMQNKTAAEVKKALSRFFDDVPNVKVLVSDSDSAFLSNEVLQLMKQRNVAYRNTEDNNHHVLGIINRFIRTLRDMNKERYFTAEKMALLIDAYNNSPHRSIGKAPAEMTKEDEAEYMKRKEEETSKISIVEFKPNERVRVLLERSKIGKNRSAYSDYAYIIDGKRGHQWIIKAKDGSTDSVPAHQLIKATPNIPLAETLKSGKRGIVSKIDSYNASTDRYKVTYDEGTTDTIPARNMREGHPLVLSFMERQYWNGKFAKQTSGYNIARQLPSKIKQWT